MPKSPRTRVDEERHPPAANPAQRPAPGLLQTPGEARTLEGLVLERTLLAMERAGACLGMRLAAPEVRFDLRGRAAGQARFGVRPWRGLPGGLECGLPGNPWLIRYNPVLLAANPADFLAETVPHEVAHLAAYARYGLKIRPHGPEWQALVRCLGGTPERCHSYDVSTAPTRRLRCFDYHCTCRNHSLSSIRHRRVLAGQTYLCRVCAAPLRPGRDESLAGPEPEVYRRGA